MLTTNILFKSNVYLRDYHYINVYAKRHTSTFLVKLCFCLFLSDWLILAIFTLSDLFQLISDGKRTEMFLSGSYARSFIMLFHFQLYFVAWCL